jgi:hypothetical protein
MRRSQRLIAALVLVALSGALAGCGSMSGFDPTDWLDFLDTKKKLPGDRKPVFPEGVPGLEQGVPKELYKGSAQQQIDQRNAEAAAATAAPPPAEPKSKRAAKGKAKQPASVSTAPAPEPAAVDPGAACSQAKENRAPAHHRAAARPTRRATSGFVATICRAIPGANAERHLHALISVLPRIDMRVDLTICAYSYRKTATHFCGIRA